MKQNFRLIPVTNSDVVILQCLDAVHFDSTAVSRLFSERAGAEAETIICRVLEDISRQLDLIQDHFAICHFENMVRPAKRIAHAADQIGLIEMSLAAQHVTTCLMQGDGVALGATMARLGRGFDWAVSEVWNFRDR